jgi:hypothetical protein
LATDFFFFLPKTNSFDTGTFLEAVAARLVFFTGDIDSFRFRLVGDSDEVDRFATAAGLRFGFLDGRGTRPGRFCFWLWYWMILPVPFDVLFEFIPLDFRNTIRKLGLVDANL